MHIAPIPNIAGAAQGQVAVAPTSPLPVVAILWFVSPLPTMTNSGPVAYKGNAWLVRLPLDAQEVILRCLWLH